MQRVENKEQRAKNNMQQEGWNTSPVVYVVSVICSLIVLCDYQRVMNTSEKTANESGSSYELRYVKDSIDTKKKLISISSTWMHFPEGKT